MSKTFLSISTYYYVVALCIPMTAGAVADAIVYQVPVIFGMSQAWLALDPSGDQSRGSVAGLFFAQNRPGDRPEEKKQHVE